MSILITTHPSALPAAHLLRALITSSSADTWAIDNKYYTACVPVRVCVIGEGEMGDALAVVWAFEREDHANPPPTLQSAISSTPQIELLFAVRLPSADPFNPEKDEDAADGFAAEYVNLSSLHSNERNEELEQMKESLQTVLWPTMVRKALPKAPIPSHNAASTVPPIHDSEDVDTRREDEALDAWLNDDDGSSPPQKHQMAGFDDDFLPSGPEGDEYTPFQSAPFRATANGPPPSSDTRQPEPFDDALDDDAFLPTDPTALLAHLSTIRTHLSTVQDPDARRSLAAREVERLFEGLGIGLEDGDL